MLGNNAVGLHVIDFAALLVEHVDFNLVHHWFDAVECGQILQPVGVKLLTPMARQAPCASPQGW